jgi:hypothetical protein
MAALTAMAGTGGECEGNDVAQRNNPNVTDDDQARPRVRSRGTGDRPARAGVRRTRDPENRGDARPRPLGSMEAARRAAEDVLELTGCEPEHVVSIAKQDDGWHIGLDVVELQRIPDSADVLAVYEVTLDARGELVTWRRERRYHRGSTEERR